MDARANALVTLANNVGELATVGLLTVKEEAVDVIDAGGFDIVSPEVVPEIRTAGLSGSSAQQRHDSASEEEAMASV